jgi:hypothetical protein
MSVVTVPFEPQNTLDLLVGSLGFFLGTALHRVGQIGAMALVVKMVALH